MDLFYIQYRALPVPVVHVDSLITMVDTATSVAEILSMLKLCHYFCAFCDVVDNLVGVH